MGKRYKARELALQALYQYELANKKAEELIKFDWVDNDKQGKLHTDITNFAEKLITGTIENIRIVDKCIKDNLDNWKFRQLSFVDLSILRFSVYSLLFLNDIPYVVTINEAVSIAKRFSSRESFRFINGLLDGIQKNCSKGGVVL